MRSEADQLQQLAVQKAVRDALATFEKEHSASELELKWQERVQAAEKERSDLQARCTALEQRLDGGVTAGKPRS